MEVSCVRNSWLTRPRSPARCPSSSSSGVRSCKVTTTDSTSPASERMGVALTRVVTEPTSGTWMTIGSARTVSPVPASKTMMPTGPVLIRVSKSARRASFPRDRRFR